jgi:homoserine dehydrogenase
LAAKRRELASRYQLAFRLTGIATGSHGHAINPAGIDPKRALRRIESGKSIARLHVGDPVLDTLDFIRRRPAQILFEITPLDPIKGQPALDHIRTALEHKIHVITANKGPPALAYRELRELARKQQCHFRFEGTVMDGAPVFNLVEKTLPASRVLGFYGILNATSNFVLTEMEKGRSFRRALKRAQAMGIAEADPSYDIDGWDAAAKTAVLANVLLGVQIRPSRVDRKGIGAVAAEDLEKASRKGRVLRLIARVSRRGGRTVARVAPELIRQDHPLAQVRGTSSALVLETDTMKELIVTEMEGTVEQTAYALLSDVLTVAQSLS